MALDEKYPLALPQGTILAGQYVIEKALGQGGFGITYKATDHKTGQSVAVKEFFPETMAARTTQTTVSAFSGERGESFAYGKGCFLQEAETLAQFIGNENIVRVYSYFEENGTAYFVMEFVEGTSFDQYIKDHGGKVPYEEAEKILLPVIDALALVHAKGIVHRDVTPDNIYITKDGKVKLLDFGAARYSLGDKSRSLDVVLKHGFAPREQYTRHGRQGAFTDVYTVGASFYFAITGRRPPDSIDRMDEDILIPPSSLGVKIAPNKEDAILTAMSVQPSSRYQTMVDFRKALMSAGEAETQPSVSSQAQPSMSQTQASTPTPVQQRVFTAPQPIHTPQPIHIPQSAELQPIHIPQQTQRAGEQPIPQPTPAQREQNVGEQPISEPSVSAENNQTVEEATAVGDAQRQPEAENVEQQKGKKGRRGAAWKGIVVIAVIAVFALIVLGIATRSRNLTKKTILEPDGYGYMIYEYNANGEITKETYCHFVMGMLYYNVYEYDTNGNQTKWTHYDSFGAVLGYVVYEYNANGNITKGTTYAMALGKEYNTGHIAYEYDSNGNQTKEAYYDSSGEVRESTVYEYDSNGNQTKKTVYDSVDELQYFIVYEYDSNGNQTKETYYNSVDEIQYYVVYEYDSNGNTTKMTKYHSHGKYYTIYECNANGKITKATDYGASGEAQYYIVYKYNTNGKITKATYYNSVDEVIQYMVYEYDTDRKETKWTLYNSAGEVLDDYVY